MAYLMDVLMRWGHIVFGVAWIGLLYYFNFVQTEYIKEADDSAKADVTAKLAPRALWWFRWAAMFTFLTGLLLIGYIMHHKGGINLSITLGALMGTIMMLNVWLIIWPNQKIVIGLESGDKAAAGPKAGLASRTNTLFSLPMLFFMVVSGHAGMNGGVLGGTGDFAMSNVALLVGLAIVLVIEANAIWGKMNGVIQSVKAVITSSVVLTIIMSGVVQYF
ncbi:MAG TPA: antitermination protein NusG [Gammaproteobacteria bacterium]|nr:antitermination protein NusG [Acidiferrobacteraceae bacterium]MDP6551417.1 urate hydroxylase PuuD [Arenicellales bacterium]MDP6791720.1 urate hydroxylase PuuD [Arenicellales bacterium]MDP6919455.1 urate hydroxylase PuuD [Arenicellales bacterium]HCX87294.1 antitermination protein NusG [Gammaproteobacteria bacterium]